MWDAGFDALGDAWLGAGDALGGATDWAASRGFSGSSGIFDAFFTGEATTGAIDGLISRFGASSGALLEDFINFKVWEGLSGHSHKYQQNWQHATGAETNPHLAAAGDTIKSHALIAEQLRKHAPDSEITRKYSELGLKLPDDALIKQVKRALTSKLHPDRLQGGDALMGKIYASLDLLGDSKKTNAYREVLEQAENDSGLKQRLEELLKNIAGKQTEFYEQTAKAARLALPFHGKAKEEMGAAERVSKAIYDGFAKRGNVGKAAIIFGVVTGVAATAYGAAKLLEKRNKNQPKKPDSFVDMVKTDKKQPKEITI